MNEHDEIQYGDDQGLSRRSAIKRAGMVGGAAAVTTWAAPSVLGIGTAQAAGSVPTTPPPCLDGIDVHFDSQWVVCEATAERAWISHLDPSGNRYHPQEICESLGYATYGAFGGTCGDVCGYCQTEQTSCDAPGNKVFDGAGFGGADANGDILSLTVTWECLAPGVAPTPALAAGAGQVANSAG